MAVRYLVDDVDAALPFYRALGFRLTDRWGPPFAVMKGNGVTLWLSGPGTSAPRSWRTVQRRSRAAGTVSSSSASTSRRR